MSQTETNTELTVKSVLNQFLNSHNLLDVLDTLQDAHTALAFKGDEEAQATTTKADFLTVQSQNFDANKRMNSVVTFVSNIIHLQTKHQ